MGAQSMKSTLSTLKSKCRRLRRCLPLCNFHKIDQTPTWLRPHLVVSDLPVLYGGIKPSRLPWTDRLTTISAVTACRTRGLSVTRASTMQWTGPRRLLPPLLLLLCCAAARVPAATRQYFLRIEEVSWNYAPTGKNVIQNRTVQDDE